MTIEANFASLARPVAFNAFEEQPGRFPSLLFGRLIDGGQRRRGISRERNVVESDDGDVFGNAQAGVPYGADRAHGREIVAREDGGRALLEREQSLHPGIAVVLRRIARSELRGRADDQLFIYRQVAFAQGVQIALITPQPRPVYRREADEVDAPVPQSDQVLDGLVCALPMVRGDAVNVWVIERAPDDHHRQVAFGQPQQKIVAGLRLPRGDDDAVGAVVEERPQRRLFALNAALAGAD